LTGHLLVVWHPVPPVVIAGSLSDAGVAEVRDRTATLAIGVDTGVF